MCGFASGGPASGGPYWAPSRRLRVADAALGGVVCCPPSEGTVQPLERFRIERELFELELFVVERCGQLADEGALLDSQISAGPDFGECPVDVAEPAAGGIVGAIVDRGDVALVEVHFGDAPF